MQARSWLRLARYLTFEISPECRRLRIAAACDEGWRWTSCSLLAEVLLYKKLLPNKIQE